MPGNLYLQHRHHHWLLSYPDSEKQRLVGGGKRPLDSRTSTDSGGWRYLVVGVGRV